MVQSVAQFGFYGVSFLYCAVVLLNVGFIAACLVIEGQALTAAVIGVIGYRAIHRLAQLTAVVAGGAIAAVFAVAVSYRGLPHAETALKFPPAGLFIAGVALLVIDMLSFGPFVSDYSRYIRPDARTGTVFTAIWTGNVISTVASAGAGAYLAALLPAEGSVAAIGKVCGSWALVLTGAS